MAKFFFGSGATSLPRPKGLGSVNAAHVLLAVSIVTAEPADVLIEDEVGLYVFITNKNIMLRLLH